MNWIDLPMMLSTHHLAEIFNRHEKTIRRQVLKGSPKVPRPCFVEPYGWRRDDVKRFYDTTSETYQRRELARTA